MAETETPKPEVRKEPTKAPELSPKEMRKDRLSQIGRELDLISEQTGASREATDTRQDPDEAYRATVKGLESDIGLPLSSETKDVIRHNLVDEPLVYAEKNREKIEGLETEKKIFDYLDRTLEGEDPKSFIPRPMDSECRVAVMIPAYNENAADILRTLESLSEQEGADSDFFEIDMVVNNRRADAEGKTPTFLANQDALRLIRYISGESQIAPSGLSDEQQKQVRRIKASRVRVNAIDKSSLETSDENNNVGAARDRAGAEILDRFMTTQARIDGIMAITDCDCTFSPNYIKSLIADFERKDLNGVSGNLEFEVDPTLPNSDLIKKAFDVYMGTDGPKQKYAGDTFVPKKNGALQAGANMAVRAKAWGLIGGMPRISGGEDVQFAKNIEKLPGRVAKEYAYSITSLIRPSERTGVQGLGRIVKKMESSVGDYVAGRTDRIFIEDREQVTKFFVGVKGAFENKSLNGKEMVRLMKECQFKQDDLKEAEYDVLAEEINAELAKPPSPEGAKKIEQLIFDKVYPFYPEKEVTDSVVGGKTDDSRGDFSNGPINSGGGALKKALGKLSEAMESGTTFSKEDIHNAVREQMARRDAYKAVEIDTSRRLKENPIPTDEELSMGAFIEEIQPQMRDAVMALRRKGYNTIGSGYDGTQTQAIRFDEPIEALVGEVGKRNLVRHNFSVKGNILRYEVPTGDPEAMKQAWKQATELLPDLKQAVPGAASDRARDFREKYKTYK